MSESQSGQPSARSASDAASIPADLDGAEQTRVADAPFVLSQEPVTTPDELDGSTPAEPSTPAPAYEHLGELPASYGTQSVYLVAYDPRQLFVYWDVDWKAFPGAAYGLHVCRADGEIEQRVDIAATDAGRYVPVAIPGGTYYVELGTHGRDGRWNPVAHSGRVTMPPEGLAGEAEPKFATLPFHLSFQRLLELIQGTMGDGENLTAALSRLQRGDQSGLATITDALTDLGSEHLQTLEMLLGQKFSVNSVGDTGADEDNGKSVLRDRHEVLGAGAFSSETLSSGALEGLPGGVSSESSLAARAGGSETLSSAGMLGPVGGFGSENLSSGAFGGDTLAAFTAGMSSETLSSLVGGPGMSSEAWRLAGAVGPGGSDLIASERAADFKRAIEHNIGVLGALFSAVNAGLGGGSGGSSGSSPTGGGSNVSSPGRW